MSRGEGRKEERTWLSSVASASSSSTRVACDALEWSASKGEERAEKYEVRSSREGRGGADAQLAGLRALVMRFLPVPLPLLFVLISE
jgi:hypothetical protein